VATIATPSDAVYALITRQLLRGRVIPFLGAGANLCDRPGDSRWEPGGDLLPSGGELARHLAQTFSYPPADPSTTGPAPSPDLLRVAQWVDAMLGDDVLYEELHRLLVGRYQPNRLHGFLAKLSGLLAERGIEQPLIVTTNYDDALERAFIADGIAFHLVWYEAKRRDGTVGRFFHRAQDHSLPEPIVDPTTWLIGSEHPVILKVHGAVDRDRADHERDSYVITEDNYIDYLARSDGSREFPRALQQRMARNHFLFLGYSLRDWNLRVILNRVWGTRPLSRRSWSVQLGVDEVEEALWRGRRGDEGVEVFDLDLAEFIDRLDTHIRGEAEPATPA
jgi:hypothetical protein